MLLLLKRHPCTQSGKLANKSQVLKRWNKNGEREERRGEKAMRCKGISGNLKIKQSSKTQRNL